MAGLEDFADIELDLSPLGDLRSPGQNSKSNQNGHRARPISSRRS